MHFHLSKRLSVATNSFLLLSFKSHRHQPSFFPLSLKHLFDRLSLSPWIDEIFLCILLVFNQMSYVNYAVKVTLAAALMQHQETINLSHYSSLGGRQRMQKSTEHETNKDTLSSSSLVEGTQSDVHNILHNHENWIRSVAVFFCSSCFYKGWKFSWNCNTYRHRKRFSAWGEKATQKIVAVTKRENERTKDTQNYMNFHSVRQKLSKCLTKLIFCFSPDFPSRSIYKENGTSCIQLSPIYIVMMSAWEKLSENQ